MSLFTLPFPPRGKAARNAVLSPDSRIGNLIIGFSIENDGSYSKIDVIDSITVDIFQRSTRSIRSR